MSIDVVKLVERSGLTDEWIGPFIAISRQVFLPDVLWEQPDGGSSLSPVDRGQQPRQWRALANSRSDVVTQVDDGDPALPGGLGSIPTSSSLRPSLVALMLRHLGIGSDEHVLEIGTGTGWNAALLAQRLGTDRVTTIEIDPAVADHARTALRAAGLGDLTVVTGTGSDGWPLRAPYTRVISTAACHTVPYAWVQQCHVGGRIVTPWAGEFWNGALIALDVHGDGTATGGVVAPAWVMRLRDQRLDPLFRPGRRQIDVAQRRTTRLTPADVMHRDEVLMAMAAWVPQCQARYSPATASSNGRTTMHLSDRRTGSWAILRADPDTTEHPVLQGGQRRLFDEVEAAYQQWREQGCPHADSWMITVAKEGQRIELM